MMTFWFTSFYSQIDLTQDEVDGGCAEKAAAGSGSYEKGM